MYSLYALLKVVSGISLHPSVASGTFCPNCGSLLAQGASFCTHCGTKIN
ncbi:zinc-ribbon domain-containing protein [Lacticaseibacillus paracasei]